MGMNTTVLILNDALTDIRDDPEFGRKLYDAILGNRSGGRVVAGRFSGAATVLETHHANILRVVAIGANQGRIVGDTFWELLRIPADDRFREEVVRELVSLSPDAELKFLTKAEMDKKRAKKTKNGKKP